MQKYLWHWYNNMNISTYKIDQSFVFYKSQNLKLSRCTCFRGFKSSLVLNSHVAKPERLALSEMWTSSFRTNDIDLRLNSLVDLNIILGACTWNLRPVFLFKLRFLKIDLLVTWLKCLIYVISKMCLLVLYSSLDLAIGLSRRIQVTLLLPDMPTA